MPYLVKSWPAKCGEREREGGSGERAKKREQEARKRAMQRGGRQKKVVAAAEAVVCQFRESVSFVASAAVLS